MNSKNNEESNIILSQKDIRNASLRSIYGLQLSWSYTKMQGSGFLYSVYPALKKIYKDDPEGLDKSIKAHMNFYNTNPTVSPLIMGITLAMEDGQKSQALTAVDGIKVGLMGPAAGIGDTIFGVIIPTIFLSIASYMAVDGSPVGVVILFIVFLSLLKFRYHVAEYGFKSGTKLITEYSEKLQAFTDSAIALGLVVIGGLIPTIVSVKLNDSLTIGEVPINLQDFMDKIVPDIMPIIFVFIGYKLLSLKFMNSTRLIFLVMAMGVILSVSGILI